MENLKRRFKDSSRASKSVIDLNANENSHELQGKKWGSLRKVYSSMNIGEASTSVSSDLSKYKINAYSKRVTAHPPCINHIAGVYSLSEEDKEAVFKHFNLHFCTLKDVSNFIMKQLKLQKTNNKVLKAYFSLFILEKVSILHSLRILAQKIDIQMETDYLDMMLSYFAGEFQAQNVEDFSSSIDVKKAMLGAIIFVTKKGIVGAKHVESRDEFCRNLTSYMVYPDEYDAVLGSLYQSLKTGDIIEPLPRFSSRMKPVFPIFPENLSQPSNRHGEMYYVGYHSVKITTHSSWEVILNPVSDTKRKSNLYRIYMLIIYTHYILLIDLSRCEKHGNENERQICQMYAQKKCPPAGFIDQTTFSPANMNVIFLHRASIFNSSIMKNFFKIFHLNEGVLESFKIIFSNKKQLEQSISNQIMELCDMIRIHCALVNDPFTKDEMAEYEEVLMRGIKISKKNNLNGEDSKIVEACVTDMKAVRDWPTMLCTRCKYEHEYKTKVLKKQSEDFLALLVKANNEWNDNTSNSKSKKKSGKNSIIGEVEGVLTNKTQLVSAYRYLLENLNSNALSTLHKNFIPD